MMLPLSPLGLEPLKPEVVAIEPFGHLQHRYMQIEGMAELTPPLIDADPAKLPPMAA